MRIAIVGCGIAGATVGHLLASAGHDVVIFEQAAVCKPVGAGLLLQPSGQRILKRLGILDEIAQRSARLDGLEAVLRSGRRLIRLRHSLLGTDCFGLGVHRGLLFERLLALAQSSGVELRTSCRATGCVHVGDGVGVVTQDGIQQPAFDFLIAADGSRSSLRAASRIPFRTVEYPYAALWTTGVTSAITDRLYQVVDGTQRLVGLLPLGEGRCSFFWGLRADGYDRLVRGGLPRWKMEVAELCPAAMETLESISSFDELTFATYRHVRMRRWHEGGIIFLGDAAHPSSPHLGQGVNLALEDAVCFAEALQEHRRFTPAAQAFERCRASKLRYYQQLTRWLTPFFQSDALLLGGGRDLCLPWFPHIPWVRSEMIRTLCGDKDGWLR